MTKGQRAMAVAKIYPDPETGGRGNKSKTSNLLVSGGFSRQRLDQSRAVLQYAPDVGSFGGRKMTRIGVFIGQQDREGHAQARARVVAQSPDSAVRLFHKTTSYQLSATAVRLKLLYGG